MVTSGPADQTGPALAVTVGRVESGDGSRTLRPIRHAWRWAAARADMWPVASAAFLARGGILLLLLPFLILPTPIGVASFVGADAVTAAGPTERFVVLAFVAGLAAGAAVVAGAVVAAAADRVVLLAWAEDPRGAGPRTAATGAARAAAHPAPAVARILAVRAVAWIPPLLAVAWAIPRISDATYRQLTLPDDLTTPIVLRVASMVPDAVALIAIAFLVGELVAGLATVHVVVDGRGAARSLARVPRDLVRRPVPVLAAFGAGVAVLLVGVGVPLAVGFGAWSVLRRALEAGGAPLPAAAAASAFAAAIVAALVAAGGVAAWRRTALAEIVADVG